MEVSNSSAYPNPNLDKWSNETNGDLGIHHFKNPPFWRILVESGRATVPRALMLGVPSGQAAVQIWEVESPLLSEKAIEGA
jgi:hypothetical protein